MPASWNLQCQTCQNVENNVICSMYDIPSCHCGGERRLISSKMGKSTIFPFVTPHIDGKPMVIESMQHLRKVEKDFGVVLSAFSHNSSNNVDPVDRNLPRYRGDDPDIRHNYKDRYRK